MAQGDGETGRILWNLTEAVIGACIEVHSHLGPGLLEGAYEAALCHELTARGVALQRQVAAPVVYKEVALDCDYRLDLLVEGQLVVELKSVAEILPVHEAQLLTYLRITGSSVGLLVNFNVAVLRHGLRRMTLKQRSSPPPRLPVPSDD